MLWAPQSVFCANCPRPTCDTRSVTREQVEGKRRRLRIGKEDFSQTQRCSRYSNHIHTSCYSFDEENLDSFETVADGTDDCRCFRTNAQRPLGHGQGYGVTVDRGRGGGAVGLWHPQGQIFLSFRSHFLPMSAASGISTCYRFKSI